MEALFAVTIVLAVVGLMVAGPLLAVFALLRIRELRRRVDQIPQLERDVRRLRELVQSIRQPEATVPRPDEPPMPATARKPTEPATPATPTTPAVNVPPRDAFAPAGPPEQPQVRVTAPQAPPSPPAGVRAAQPPPPPRARIDWERWIGIRGAAVLGAVALGLAGLLFFKYSIEQGLITPTMRVVLGTITGLACLVGSRGMRARGYRFAAEGVAGGGVVILFAAFWAAHAMYGLIGWVPAFVLMALVTLACCLIALADSSLIVAVLGLVGGFATPLLLSSGVDRPLGLFGYVLLLDLGLLTLGYKRNWPSLGLLSLVGTGLLEAVWMGTRMGPDRMLLGLIILSVFALVFVAAGSFARDTLARGKWIWSQASAVLFPFAFALYFAGRVELAPQLIPLGLLLVLLTVAAGWLARKNNLPSLDIGAAAAAVAVVGVWVLQHPASPSAAWQVVAVAVGLCGALHLFVEREPGDSWKQGPAPAALVAAAGFALLLAVGVVQWPAVGPWPWVAGWAALTALVYRHASFPGRAPLQAFAGAGLALGLSLLHLVQFRDPSFERPLLYLALLVVAAVTLNGVALLRKHDTTKLWADRAAAVLTAVSSVLLAVAPLTRTLAALPVLGVAFLLGALGLLAATRLRSGAWYAAAVGTNALVQVAWTFDSTLADRPGEATRGLLMQFATVVLFTGWWFVARRPFAARPWARYAAALAGPIALLPMLHLFETAFGDAFVGLLPLALAGVSVAALVRSHRIELPGTPERLGALVWFSAAALGFVSIAIPLQLEKEWITIGWALQGLAVTLLWKRLDHPGLKYFGLALLGAATVRLVGNPALLGYYPRSGMRILNWLLYTYLVPAAALLGAAAVLRPYELVRLRVREKRYYVKPLPFGAIGCSVAAMLVTFVWINLAIADWFATGTTLTLSFGTEPAQRLTVSIAWATYALGLLGLGMSRGSQGLRWVSLSFLLVTIAKVFLYDLGQLRDLYRVASLVGLAVSLILVSLLYQRFVFREIRGDTP